MSSDHPEATPPFDRQRELAFVRAVLARQPAALMAFEERTNCIPRILRGLNRRHGHPLSEHDLSDLEQDTRLIVWRKLGEFQALAPLEGWIYQLCFLEFLNAIRRRARQQRRTSELLEEHGSPGPQGPPPAHDEVYRALEQLGGAEADVIRLKHFEELTFEEIGRRFDIPPNTAKTRYYRGMERLGTILRAMRRREDTA